MLALKGAEQGVKRLKACMSAAEGLLVKYYIAKLEWNTEEGRFVKLLERVRTAQATLGRLAELPVDRVDPADVQEVRSPGMAACDRKCNCCCCTCHSCMIPRGARNCLAACPGLADTYKRSTNVEHHECPAVSPLRNCTLSCSPPSPSHSSSHG